MVCGLKVLLHNLHIVRNTADMFKCNEILTEKYTSVWKMPVKPLCICNENQLTRKKVFASVFPGWRMSGVMLLGVAVP